jgi:hypothetical protein
LALPCVSLHGASVLCIARALVHIAGLAERQVARQVARQVVSQGNRFAFFDKYLFVAAINPTEVPARADRVPL